MLTSITLVKLKSLDPKIEPVVRWFKLLDFWSLRIEKRITEARLHVPVDIETLFREKFELPLIEPTRTLLCTLLQKENGMELAMLGYKTGSETPPGAKKPWEDPETCTGKLRKLGLVRFQDNILLKPINSIAFDPRVQFLIGLRKQPVL
ncbi:MAG TPA: hypothetical protein VMR19_03050 [Candidatus Saccharimonadales bacterium]|jgi:hypothetical protein|nr:hypothetical protein [Candidatus Saccharimonadales bacterium]